LAVMYPAAPENGCCAAMPGADTSRWTPPERIAAVVRSLVETEGFDGAHLTV